MNFTVDDSDPSISYSADGWAVQSQDDPDLDQFFQKTYHVATQDQATMVFQFSGTAFTLYGSKGPGHATFDVQYDGAAAGGLTASAPTTAFRQVLFAHSFSDRGTAAQHLVKVTAHLVAQNRWLDVDYITFTNGNGSTSSIATATVAPPWLTSSSSVVGPSGFSIPSSSSSLSESAPSKVPTILAALFGAILGLALLSLLAWFVLRRVCARHRARERAFRYGQSSVNPAAAAAAITTTTATSSVKGGAYPPSASVSSPSARSPNDASALMMRERTTTPYSHSHSQRDGSFSMASNVVELQSMDERERITERERERVGTPATSRGLISQSPIAWTASLKKMGAGHRGDADSLRTDFLQV